MEDEDDLWYATDSEYATSNTMGLEGISQPIEEEE